MRTYPTICVLTIVLFITGIGFAREGSAAKQVTPLQARQRIFESERYSPREQVSGKIHLSLRSDSLVWWEDFEDSAPDWTSMDETVAEAFWHPDAWNAFGSSGNSWWVADTSIGTNGGYDNRWYQVLDTGPIDLAHTAHPLLTFQQRFSCEPPVGAESPYDGWDGMNVRVSEDDGTTWTVLQNPSPAYSANSLYSFGLIHGEGANVPGWAGDQLDWTAVSIDLSAFAGKVIRIRFAFASDGAASAADPPSGNPAWFGWQIDDILVAEGQTTLFWNNGTTAGMTASSNVPVGGDLWHIAEGVGNSGTRFAACSDTANGSYRPGMNNSLYSSWFWLPDTLDHAFLDFALQGTFDDNDAFPAVDFFGAFVQVKGETSWRYLSNITMDPNGSNFVYSSAPDSWFWFSQAYTVGLPDLTPLLGDSIRIIFNFQSDEDTPMGTGLQIDDVIIWSPVKGLEVPQNLIASAGDGFVDLSWDEMNVEGHRQFVHDDGSFEDGIFTNSGTFDAGVYFNSPARAKIDTLWVWGYNGNTGSTTTLKVWSVVAGVIQNAPLFSKEISLTRDQWNLFDLTADNWVAEGDFVAGIEAGTFPNNDIIYIPIDQNSIPSSHSMVNLGSWSSWKTVASANGLSDGEWGIRSAVTYTQPTNITYNVYRRLQADATFGSPLVSGLSTAGYHDAAVTNGETYCYAVSATYPGEGESALTANVCATPRAASVYDLAGDDGTPESFFPVGSGNYVAVKFTPLGWPHDVVKVLAYFKDGIGSALVKVWDENGTSGLPGNEIASVNMSNIQTGWNEVTVSGVTISAGNFFVGLRFTPTTPELGIDDTAPTNGMSYLQTGGSGTWETFSGLGLGDAMIRCQMDSLRALDIADVENGIIKKFELFQNYPNPFNPETSITFAVPNFMAGERVTLKVFDILGREVATLTDGTLKPGNHRVQWNGRNVTGAEATSGIYFYTLRAGNKLQTRKMILMR